MTSALNILSQASESFQRVTSIHAAVDTAAQAMIRSLKAGGHLFFCGNGGSAGDAQHLAAEFLGRFMKERRPLPATALTTNSSSVTAIGNDYGYELVFARQLAGLARPGDVLVGISTSGGSANVIEAMRVGRERGMVCVSLTGSRESPMSAAADIAILAPSTSTPRIQEMHIAIGHTICEIVEDAMIACE